MAKRDEIRAAMQATAGGHAVKVDIKEWPDLYARPILVGEAEDHDKETKDKKIQSERRIYADLAARCACYADGTLQYDWRNADDIALLESQPLWMLVKIIKAAGEGDDAGN